jgi:hypothetical protein
LNLLQDPSAGEVSLPGILVVKPDNPFGLVGFSPVARASGAILTDQIRRRAARISATETANGQLAVPSPTDNLTVK